MKKQHTHKCTLTYFSSPPHTPPQNGDSVDRFVGPLKGRYKGVGPHGFSVWAKNRLCVNDLKNFTGIVSSIPPPHKKK